MQSTNARSAHVPVSNALRLDIPVQGMTCASCVARVQKALLGVPGVQEASVNFVTGQARVLHDPSAAPPAALAEAIVRAGYRVAGEVPGPGSAAQAARTRAASRAAALEQAEEQERLRLKRDFLFATLLTVPLLGVAMSHGRIPGLDGAFGRWLQLALATPVVLGPGRRFFVLAWGALRHGAADMNTLVALGTGAAWAYSTVAVIAPGLFPHGTHGHL